MDMKMDNNLFRLKEYYRMLVCLLETYFESSSLSLTPSEELNTLYLTLTLEIEDMISKLKKRRPKDVLLLDLITEYRRPVDNLLSVSPDDMPDLWEYSINPGIKSFQSKLEEIYIGHGSPEGTLDPKDQNLLTNVIVICKQYQEIMKSADQQWLDNIQQTIKTFGQDQSINPRLTIDEAAGKFEYTTLNGKAKVAYFGKTTSEYAILMHLAQNPRTPYTSGDLSDHLEDPREGAEDADPKRRAKDIIQAIREKLDKDVVKTTKAGYLLGCEVNINK